MYTIFRHYTRGQTAVDNTEDRWANHRQDIFKEAGGTASVDEPDGFSCPVMSSNTLKSTFSNCWNTAEQGGENDGTSNGGNISALMVWTLSVKKVLKLLTTKPSGWGRIRTLLLVLKTTQGLLWIWQDEIRQIFSITRFHSLLILMQAVLQYVKGNQQLVFLPLAFSPSALFSGCTNSINNNILRWCTIYMVLLFNSNINLRKPECTSFHTCTYSHSCAHSLPHNVSNNAKYHEYQN